MSGILPNSDMTPPTSEIKDQILRWYANEWRQGSSSRAMARFFIGDPIRDWEDEAHPHDPSDFQRCLLFLEAVPLAKPRLGELSTLSPAWKKLIDRWAELEQLFLKEIAGAGPLWSAPKTFDLMQQILREAERE